MKFKGFFIICCFLMLLLLISTVSASDDNSLDILNANEEPLNQIDIDGIDQTQYGDGSDGSFENLANEINSSEDVLVLNKNYTYSGNNNSGILISKPITIDGRGFTLNGNDASRIFTITSNDVTLKNINFLNANAPSSGGAVFAKANNIEIINCNFTNSKSTTTGAALTLMGNNITVINSNFINGCVVKGYFLNLHPEKIPQSLDDGTTVVVSGGDSLYAFGGAIYIEGNVSVKSCKFKSNKADSNGGAIFIWSGSNLSINDSTFNGNEVKGSMGYYNNDIYVRAKTTIVNSSFNNKKFIVGNIELINSTVEVPIQTPSDIEGSFGELLRKINESGEILVLDKDYKYVDGDNRGVEISKPITIIGNGHTLDASKLSRIFTITSNNVTLINMKFINGVSYSKYTYNSPIGGGAIYWVGVNGKLINCTFEANTASGTVSHDAQDVYTENVDYDYTYSMSTTTIDTPNVGGETNIGGAICWIGDNAFIFNSEFRKNYVDYPNRGGAIYMSSANALIDSSNFYANSAWCGIAIYYFGTDLVINSSHINETSGYGSGHYAVDGNNFKIINPKSVYESIKRNDIISGSFEDLQNKINNAVGTLVLNDDFTQFNKSSISINKTITIDGQGHIIDANKSSSIFFITADNVVLKNINFVKAKAVYAGGAIAWIGDNACVINCTFTNCTANTAGGSIALKGDNAKFIDSSFTNSHVNEGTWGLIAILDNFKQDMVYITVMASVGGAMYIVGSNTSIDNSKFINNSVGEPIEIIGLNNGGLLSASYVNPFISGGALYVDGDNLVISDSIFENNSAPGENDYYSSSKATITNSVFNGVLSYKKDSSQNQTNVTQNMTVEKIQTTIYSQSISSIYKEDKYLIITLKDNDNKPVNGVTVLINLNGAKYFSTDLNGQVKISTKDLTPKTYIAIISFAGDDKYAKSTSTTNVIIKKATLKLSASEKTFKKSLKTKKYSIILKDNKNKAIGKCKVTLKVKGKTYVAKTNAKGKATFKITKLTKKGTFNAVIKFAGNSFYNSKSVMTTIVCK